MTSLTNENDTKDLITTAQEKICVLVEDAKEDVEKIIDMVEDLELFWDSDGI